METYKDKSLKELISITREQLIGKYSVAILANVLIGLISLIVLSLISNISEVVNTATYLLNIGISLIVDVLMGVLIFGRNAFFLRLVRGENNLRISAIFIGFKKNTDKAIIIEAIYILVSLLGILPVTLARIGLIPISEDAITLFSIIMMGVQSVLRLITNLFLLFTYYILADHPEYGIKQILEESIFLMKNKKGRLLLIYLCMIPLGILGFLSCGIGSLLVEAFFETLLANFYLDAIHEEPKNPITCSDSTTSDTH